MKINNFRGDLSSISAKTATLARTSDVVLKSMLHMFEILWSCKYVNLDVIFTFSSLFCRTLSYPSHYVSTRVRMDRKGYGMLLDGTSASRTTDGGPSLNKSWRTTGPLPQATLRPNGSRSFILTSQNGERSDWDSRNSAGVNGCCPCISASNSSSWIPQGKAACYLDVLTWEIDCYLFDRKQNGWLKHLRHKSVKCPIVEWCIITI